MSFKVPRFHDVLSRNDDCLFGIRHTIYGFSCKIFCVISTLLLMPMAATSMPLTLRMTTPLFLTSALANSFRLLSFSRFLLSHSYYSMLLFTVSLIKTIRLFFCFAYSSNIFLFVNPFIVLIERAAKYAAMTLSLSLISNN
jgi:hypothetical protein